MGRAPCCEKDSVKRGPWTPEEDAKLLACIGQYGTGSWRTLPKKAGLQRCGKSCRLRWTNYLRPDLKHGRFSDQEEQLIVKLHAALGSRWSLIAAQLPGRTDNDVKNYWNTRLKKKLCEMGIDPITHKPISQLLADLAGSMTLPKGSEIAEATLGCFRDDMLNVLMRKRSDSAAAAAAAASPNYSSLLNKYSCSTSSSSSTTSCNTHFHNNNMSFAPLTTNNIHHQYQPAAPRNNVIELAADVVGTTAAPPPTVLASILDRPHPPPTSSMTRPAPHLLELGRSTTSYFDAALINSTSRRSKSGCTPAPCGPVSGIRSASAGAALQAARNHAGNRPLIELMNPSSSAKPETTASSGVLQQPAFACQLLTSEALHDQFQYIAAGSSLSAFDPSSSNMLDMLLDQASYADMKEVPDLNLMQNHEQSICMRRGDHYVFDIPGAGAQLAGEGPMKIPGFASDLQAGNANQSSTQVELEAMRSESADMNKRNMYALLLAQQQELAMKEQRTSLQQLSAADRARMNMKDDVQNTMSDVEITNKLDSKSLSGSIKIDSIKYNMGSHVNVRGTTASCTTATNNMQQQEDGISTTSLHAWSPVSYTNSGGGSSSSNLSLSMTAPPGGVHHMLNHISPLDSVLTSSDALQLWDLSELGSMVS